MLSAGAAAELGTAIAQFTEVRKQFSFKTFNQLKFLASAEMVLV